MSLSLTDPAWLWLLVPVTVWLTWLERRTRRGSAWRDLVDPHLLEHLLVRPEGRHRRGTILLLCGAGVYPAILALAGPAIHGESYSVALTTPLLLITALVAALGFRRGWLG